MARLVTSGFEFATGSAATAPDGSGAGSAGTTYDSAIKRSGALSLKIAGDVAVGVNWSFTAITSGNDAFLRSYVYVPTGGVPANPADILAINAAFLVRIETNKTLTLWYFNGGGGGWTQVGSASSAITLDAWNRIELRARVGVGSVDQVEGRLEGASFASGSSLNQSDTTITQVTVGQSLNLSSVLSPGASAVIYHDDVAANDSSGASQTSWPGSGKVVLLQPISLNANGGSWTDSAAATTSAALTGAIDNSPPTGIADTTASAGHQDRNAAANTSLDMNLATYTTAGIAAADTINVLVPFCNTGAPVVTAAKTGSLGITTNPTIANVAFVNGGTAAANFWSGVTAGTYPTGWKWERGTTTYAPSVTVGSSPVARVTITGGTVTRIALLDALGMYVDYTPATPKSPPFQARTARNMLLRR